MASAIFGAGCSKATPNRLLVDPLDLGAQSQQEPAAGQLCQVPGSHRGDGGASRKRQSYIGPNPYRRGRRAGHGCLNEGRSGRLGAPHALEPGRFCFSRQLAEPPEISSHDDTQVHDGRRLHASWCLA